MTSDQHTAHGTGGPQAGWQHGANGAGKNGQIWVQLA